MDGGMGKKVDKEDFKGEFPIKKASFFLKKLETEKHEKSESFGFYGGVEYL